MCVTILWHTIVLKRRITSGGEVEKEEEEEKWEMKEGSKENEAQENGGNKLWKLHISEKDFLSSVENSTLNGKEAG